MSLDPSLAFLLERLDADHALWHEWLTLFHGKHVDYASMSSIDCQLTASELHTLLMHDDVRSQWGPLAKIITHPRLDPADTSALLAWMEPARREGDRCPLLPAVRGEDAAHALTCEIAAWSPLSEEAMMELAGSGFWMEMSHRVVPAPVIGYAVEWFRYDEWDYIDAWVVRSFLTQPHLTDDQFAVVMQLMDVAFGNAYDDAERAEAGKVLRDLLDDDSVLSAERKTEFVLALAAA